MKSFFKSSVLIPFLNFFNRIRQIPFDRDRDQLQLGTFKNDRWDFELTKTDYIIVLSLIHKSWELQVESGELGGIFFHEC